ncbi:hypothetical protein AcV5_001656 [Taiwanofungus camphoratus]|nr:hypothetical protein AcV5_001656 [Antrodia cinnamomea]KAI0933187.1 hypothetical protein AcV7_004730 [Antrodia cinnamomea]
MAAIVENHAPIGHPFIQHLVAVMSAYESGSVSSLLLRYDGPSDTDTDTVLRSLGNITRRMYTAEAALASISASESSGPESKKRRSGGDSIPMASSSASSSRSDTPMRDITETNAATHAAPEPPTRAADRPLQTGPSSVNESGLVAAPPTAPEDVLCPSCGKLVTDSDTLAKVRTSLGEPMSSQLHFLSRPVGSLPDGSMSLKDELDMTKAIMQDVIRVCNSIARGDLSQRMTVHTMGVVYFHLKECINDLVDKLRRIAKEVTRVSWEVGVDGKYGGQALILDVDGSWRDLTVGVNKLASKLTDAVKREGRERRPVPRSSYVLS